ncbi:MAG: AbgT family transporter [Bacteroidales bacterium]|nr:AbgT family transporter [Bacteroidales bacterium]MCF8344351.1 AbgT family transporter [Bacteroidales bacterium]MCF8350916.1 AbgT family transporter [Bacteroidales bacterium]MCF8375790.1 AbgT family transporter [Bacteroidales bacterium]
MAKKKKIPHTYVIIFSIIIFAAMLTWVIPGGSFQREHIALPSGAEREVIVPGSFEFTQSDPQTWEVFSALYDAFVDPEKAAIIIFILLIGGAFWIMNDSKAIDVAIFSFLKRTRKLEKYRFFRKLGVNNIIMTLIMLMFSVFGAVFGMSEETIAFIIIFVPLAISMGYDSIVGVSLCFVAAGLGFAGAMLNPFTIGIAQGLSSVPMFSGIEYRFICWVIINIVGITYVLRYAAKVRKRPEKSLVYEEDKYWRDKASGDIKEINYKTPAAAWFTFVAILAGLIAFSVFFPQSELSVGNDSVVLPIIPLLTGLYVVVSIIMLRRSAHFFVFNLLIFTILFLIVGVMGYDWYIKEIATLFFVMGLASGFAMSKSPSKITVLFLDGVKDIMSAALIVGLAGGIIIILNNGNNTDTLLYYASESMKNVGRVGSIAVMYVIQTLINIIIPSGSAKAALTMPIMAPFSDLIGISRQSTIMAFQFGDGFTNMITPTSGVLIGVLGVAKIPYDKWVRWITPIMIVLILLGFLLLIPTVTMDLEGF